MSLLSRPDIHLDDLETNEELGLIALVQEGGRTYGKVCHGFMCLDVRVFGEYVKLRDSCPEIDAHFYYEYRGQPCYADIEQMRRTADVLDATLISYGFGDTLRVQRNSGGSPTEFTEALFGVEILRRMPHWPANIGPGPGFLTWKNYD